MDESWAIHGIEVEILWKMFTRLSSFLSLVALSILVALVVKELKTLNASLRNFEVGRMKTRLEDLGLRKKAG